MPPHARRIAYCHLLLRGTRWIPVSVNRKLGPNDRSAPNGVVVSALLCAVIEKDTITEWLEHSAFSVSRAATGWFSEPVGCQSCGAGDGRERK